LQAIATNDPKIGSSSNKSSVSHYTCCVYCTCELNTYSKSP
jgi:hypothetical protein